MSNPIKIEFKIKSDSCIRVFWVSRHDPLPAQILKLKEILGEFSLVKISGTIPTVDHLLDIIKHMKKSKNIIIPVLPLSFIARLCEVRNREGFDIWYAEMKQIAETKDINEAQRVVNEKPETRTLTTYADGTIKVFEFISFKRIKQVKIELEDIM